MQKVADILVRYRAIFAVMSVILLVFMLKGMTYLYFETDHKIFFNEDNPQLLAHENNQETYIKTDNITFVLELADQKVFTRETLASIKALTELSWQMPFSGRVDSITNYQHTQVIEDDLIVDDFVLEPGVLSDADLVRLESIALSEARLVNLVISEKAHTTAVSVDLNLPDDQTEAKAAKAEVVGYAKRLIQSIEAENPNIKIHLFGQTMVNHTFNELSKQDIELLIPIMFVVILILLQVILRSVAGTIATFLIIAASAIYAEGFMGWIGFAINQVNVGVPIIVMTIAVCDCVHILNNYLFNLGQDRHKIDAMRESLYTNLQPIFLTSITTAIGFASMNFSDSPPFRELGTVSAFGVMSAFVLSMTLFPALVLLFPFKGRQQTTNSQWMDKLSGVVISQPRWMFCGLLALAGVLVALMFKNELNDDTVQYFDKGVPFREAADFTQANLTGFHSIAYSLKSGQENGVVEPAFLQKIEAFRAWYLAQPEVVYVSAFTDIMKRLNQTMHGDDPTWYRIPEDRALAAQYLLLYEMSLPFGLDLNNLLNVDRSSTLLTVRVKGQKSNQLIALDQRAQAWLKEYAPELQTEGASVSIMFAHIGKRNIDSMLTGSFFALVLVTLTLLLALRSWKYGLISLLPNAFPAGMAFGVWGIFVGEVNLAVAVIFAVTLGIVVDDTVHFLTKYLKAKRKHGKSAEASVKYAFQIVGRAIITTTIVLAAGFYILAFSDFSVNSTMGIMVAGTIVLALLWDFLFLPALLIRVDREKETTKVNGTQA